MAQLIKLNDYVSRYEWNVYRYPSQYMRLKQDNWKKLYGLWNAPIEEVIPEGQDAEPAVSTFSKWKHIFKRGIVNETPAQDQGLPETEQELKQYFLDELYPVQLKWASSTVADISFMQKGYEDDQTLKYFLQRFPDTYLLMYYPVFTIKKAPIDGEIILISPIGVEIIYLLKEDQSATIVATNGRAWKVETNRQESTILSPLLALKRTEQIVKSILHKNEIDFPVQKVVLSKTNPIVVDDEAYDTKIVGKQAYKNWFTKKRNLVSPLKNRQLKVADALLKHCRTTSIKRPEWEEEQHPFSMDNEV